MTMLLAASAVTKTVTTVAFLVGLPLTISAACKWIHINSQLIFLGLVTISLAIGYAAGVIASLF